MAQNILERKDENDYDKDVLKYLSIFNLPKTEAMLKGSSQYKHMLWRSDYDLLATLSKSTSPTVLFTALQKVLLKVEKEPDIYFIELKYETKQGLKIRMHPGDVLGYNTLERHYSDLNFIKLDCVVRLKNKFYELTCIYAFKDEPKMTPQETIKQLEDDIKEYKHEGNYYKVLKREFSIAVINNNQVVPEFLTRFFNSKTGLQYEILCNLKAIELLHQYYTDKWVAAKIDLNLKLIHMPPEIGPIHLKIYKMGRLINLEARKIYDKLKTELNFP